MRTVVIGVFVSALSCIATISVGGQTSYALSDFDNTYRHQIGAFVETPTCSARNIATEVSAQLASDSGWPSGPWSEPNQVRDYYRAIVNGTKSGLISIVQYKYTNPSTSDTYQAVVVAPVQNSGPFYLIWEPSTSYGHDVRIGYAPFYGISYQGEMLGFDLDSSCNIQFHSVGGAAYTFISSDSEPTSSGVSWTSIDLVTNGSPRPPLVFRYPAGYAGALMADEITDSDGDGLTVAQELEQGTYDNNIDSDGDGLDDETESVWKTNRDDIFCKTSVTPHVCTYPHPNMKDVYVEIDWMYDPVNSRSFKPTSNQLSLVETAFAQQDIFFHADTGQYGGGDVLPTYEETLYTSTNPSAVDFGDYKVGFSSYPANFSSDRDGIWRYMISGYNYAEDTDSSGIAEASGDNIFISNGLVKDGLPIDEDDAIAGTMIHELGHTLCLSGSQAYQEQPSECVYNGIDSSDTAFLLYNSAMNYRYQMNTVDYSKGINGLADHDDWTAVKLGMGNFNKIKTSMSASRNSFNETTGAFNPSLAIPNEK